jgi:TonB family protein
VEFLHAAFRLTPWPGYRSHEDLGDSRFIASTRLPSFILDTQLKGPDLVDTLLAENREAAFAGLAAQVESTLNSDGSLKNAQPLESSGSAEFDQAVLSTFNRVKASGFFSSEAGKSFRVRSHVADGT